MEEKINTGGMKKIIYRGNYKPPKLSKKEEADFEKAVRIGKRKQKERNIEQKRRDLAWEKRWKRYNLWKKIKPIIIISIIILILIYLSRR